MPESSTEKDLIGTIVRDVSSEVWPDAWVPHYAIGRTGFLDLQQLVRRARDVLHQRVPMHGLVPQGSQDHQLERAWKQVFPRTLLHRCQAVLVYA